MCDSESDAEEIVVFHMEKSNGGEELSATNPSRSFLAPRRSSAFRW